MTAYNIIHRHPEWVTSERTPRAAIQNEARRYVRELEGSKNFCSLITEDLDDLLRHRDATNDFAGIVTDNSNKTQVSEESPEYMADKRKAQIYAIFIKAIITELSGKAICTAAQVEEWRERYAVKLEGLKGKTIVAKENNRYCNVPNRTYPILDSRAKKIYNKLIEYKYIDCEESAFLWYFGEEPHRREKKPKKLKWLGDKIEIFALLWKKLNAFATDSNVSWDIITDIFDLSEDWKNKNFKEKARQAEECKIKNREEKDKVINIFTDITQNEKDEERQRLIKAGMEIGKEQFKKEFFSK